MTRRSGVRQAVRTWHDLAACKGVPQWVFTDDDEPLPDGTPREPYDDAVAKSYCQECPVLETCREDALDRRDYWLTRGGLNETELRAEQRRRQRKRAA
ncbi:WhiB family transcriptional regulator [Planomonospora sp. ID82291]|uniref:WhiB family transcriptional regulator n=1 Tax=Planomonospora sp. ID82291 TaxID=2738136 RepID=UPI0018C3DE54|nr:WhiB family transcriptional regulator [Planomonospora sp. ID82291]MBG0819009.1 WhiB family transcriptional regulator [Planomonospora sp. ID82291]